MKNYLITFKTEEGLHTTRYTSAENIKKAIKEQDYLIKKMNWEIVIIELKEEIKNEEV